MILDRVTKAKVLYKDILFLSMRVNNNNEPIIYDFAIIIEPNIKALGL